MIQLPYLNPLAIHLGNMLTSHGISVNHNKLLAMQRIRTVRCGSEHRDVLTVNKAWWST